MSKNHVCSPQSYGTLSPPPHTRAWAPPCLLFPRLGRGVARNSLANISVVLGLCLKLYPKHSNEIPIPNLHNEKRGWLRSLARPRRAKCSPRSSHSEPSPSGRQRLGHPARVAGEQVRALATLAVPLRRMEEQTGHHDGKAFMVHISIYTILLPLFPYVCRVKPAQQK
jgi:hypothetical protein